MKREFHPFTFWAIFTALTVAVVISDSVIAAGIALGGASLVVYFKREEGPWRSSFQWAIVAGLILVVIRAITGILIGVPRVGDVLFTIPTIHLPGWLPGIRIGGAVTRERLSSALHEGFIIATVIALFGAANSVTSPHKLLRVLPSRIYHLAVTMTIATSVFPQLIGSATRIREAQLIRSGRKPPLYRIAIPLLEESLGRAVNLAESMEARGFGQSKHHSRYRPMTYSLRDLLFMASGFVLAIGVATL
jgi:energy-coupling factor transport system permease protein